MSSSANEQEFYCESESDEGSINSEGYSDPLGEDEQVDSVDVYDACNYGSEPEEGQGPYSEEPLATAEWLEQYNAELRIAREREKELKDRLNGVTPVNAWCKCGHCKVELLRKERETMCCKEIYACKKSLEDQLVLAELEIPPQCITLHPGFSPVCLNKWSLRSVAPKYRTMQGIKYRQTGPEDTFLRATSYRECTQLIHGYLGGGKRIPLPACAYHSIRSEFGIEDDDNDYAGYEDDED